MRPRSLRAIVAIYVAIILCALVAVRITSYFVTHNALGAEVDRRLAVEMAAVIGGNVDGTAGIVARIAAAREDHDTADLYYGLFDAGGHRIAGHLAMRHVPPPGYSDFGAEAGVYAVDHGRALTRRLASGGAMVIVSDNDVIDDFDELLFRVQLAGLGTAALIMIGGAIGITLSVGNRMRAMQRVVDSVIAGNLHDRIALDGTRSEFDQQAAAFNRMLDRIEDLMGNVKHAAKDVTHELKSPLARLRNRIAQLVRQNRTDPIAPDIEDLLAQTDAILELFSSLLRLWEIEGGHRRDRFAEVDIGVLATEVGDALEAVAEDSGHHLALSIAPDVRIRGDAALLRQLFVNLVENAIRHTPTGTRISVRSEVAHGSLVIAVADTGPGIPTDQHAAVIRRFGRLEASSDLPGQGLGLTLVDAIARLHGGRLVLEDAAPGLRAIVAFPVQTQT